MIAALSSDNLLSEMEMSRKTAEALILVGVFVCLSCILLLRWKMEGLVLLCYASILGIFTDPTAFSIAFSIVEIAFVFALLQLKKNDISAWTHLTGKYSPSDIAIIPAPSEKQDEYKKCPFCAESIKKEATVCRFCQRSVG